MDAEDTILEPTLDVLVADVDLGREVAPVLEPAVTLQEHAPASATPPSRYWQAQVLADALQQRFSAAQKAGNRAAMRDCFYLLANYYTRTLAILRTALNKRREPLAQAALHNLIALHAALHTMYTGAPGTVPSALALNREVRSRLLESFIMRILQDAPRPLGLAAITKQFNALDILADASEQVIHRHLNNLIATGHLRQINDLYACTARSYTPINVNQAALQALVGPTLFEQLAADGFHGLADVTAHRSAFRSLFCELTGLADGTGALFLAAVEVVLDASGETPLASTLQLWQHADLLRAPFVRPYQYEAYTIFRSYGYQGQVIEAPTGSGKTMIGMLCIQDWLRSLTPGQSMLVLVPTVNYQQQWVGELCYKPLGLQLSPHLVFSGTPANLEAARTRAGNAPCVLVMTYTSLAQTGSGIGKGGFDQDSIEMFLQGNNVQYVIFDEVHKVVEDMSSVSAAVTRLLMEWIHDRSLKGAIGFSGTAVHYRARFAQLGMQLVYILPAAELIAYGFVAPFAEFGVPFAYSDREQRIRDLLDAYRAHVRDFITLVGTAKLRRWFASIPLEERVTLGRDILRMYAGRQDQDEALAKRFTQWEQGKELALSELSLVTLIQLSTGWSDEDLVHASVEEVDSIPTVDMAQQRFEDLLHSLEAMRDDLKPLIYLADSVRRLNVEGFGRAFAAESVLRMAAKAPSVAVRAERVKDGLATTIVGLYSSLSDWYLRVGEGRVDCMKAIIEAERASRPVHGVIIFDAGQRIRWQSGVAAPGYAGVAGVFSQMLGDRRFIPMAVLSNEIYLAYDEADPLPMRIADFIRREIMLGEQGEALFGLSTQGLDIPGDQLTLLHSSFIELLAQYISTLRDVQAPRLGEFYHDVFVPLRKVVRQAPRQELPPSIRSKLLARLSIKHSHIRNSLETLFDYAAIVEMFQHAHVAQLVQVNDALQKFYVVPMAQGERKQLMYDLSARIVDAEDLPVNMIIVSPWARTGWNVIKPNVLIDATATRDVTAWQQLRGRAMRALRSWTNTCYRLVLVLMSDFSEQMHAADGSAAESGMPSENGEDWRKQALGHSVLDDAARTLLREVHRDAQDIAHAACEEQPQPTDSTTDALAAKIERGVLADFSSAERVQLATELMQARNKVTHIYELVKAYGSTPQVRFDRAGKQWLRADAIAAKHAREYAVSPLSGHFGAGTEHAPLIYSGDPRKDVPSELQAHITAVLQDCDARVVRGWLATIVGGMQETEA